MYDSRVDATRVARFGRDDGELEKCDRKEESAVNCSRRSDFWRWRETLKTGAGSVGRASDGGVDEVAGYQREAPTHRRDYGDVAHGEFSARRCVGRVRREKREHDDKLLIWDESGGVGRGFLVRTEFMGQRCSYWC